MKLEQKQFAFWRHLLLLLTCCGAIWALASTQWDLQGSDETRYVQVARELLERDNPFLLTVHGVPYDQKPPLPFWFYALVLDATDGVVHTLAIRSVPILFSLGVLLCTALLGRRLLGARAGILAGWMTATAPVFFGDAMSAGLDSMFAFWTVGAWCALLGRDPATRLSPWAAAGLWLCIIGGFFTKGPLILLLVLPLPVWSAVKMRSLDPLRAIRLGKGLLVLLLLVTGWFAAQAHGYGFDFIRQQIVGETVGRFSRGAHGAPWYFYFLRLFGGIMGPWALLLVGAGWLAWKRRGELTHAERGLWISLLVPFLMLAFANGKRQTYLIPLIPLMALLAGQLADRWMVRGAASAGLGKAIGFLLLPTAVIVAVGASLGLLAPWLYWSEGFLLSRPLSIAGFAAVLLILAAAVIVLRGGGQRGRVFASVVLVLLVVLGYGETVVKSSRNAEESSRAFSQRLTQFLRHADLPMEVGGLGKGDKTSYHLYGGYRVRGISRDDFDPRSAPTPVIVGRGEDWAAAGTAEDFRAAGLEQVFSGEVADDKIEVWAQHSAVEVARGKSWAGDRDEVELAILGDVGTGDPEVFRIGQLLGEKHQHVGFEGALLLGDNIYGDGRFSKLVRKRFKAPFEPLLRENVPFFAVLGNHDVEGDKLKKTLKLEEFNMHGRRYYREDFGRGVATVLALDSEGFFHSPRQLLWLREELQWNTAKWKLVMLHRPINDFGPGERDQQQIASLLRPLFKQGSADVVLSGHDHVYERHDLTGDVLHLTVGSTGKTGGSSLESRHSRKCYGDSRVFLWARIQGEEMEFRAVNEHGALVDWFRVLGPQETLKVEELAHSPDV